MKRKRPMSPALKGKKTMMRMARPAHPGQFIRMEVIEPLDLSVTQAAKVLDQARDREADLKVKRYVVKPPTPHDQATF